MTTIGFNPLHTTYALLMQWDEATLLLRMLTNSDLDLLNNGDFNL